jgi:hypothetical protein
MVLPTFVVIPDTQVDPDSPRDMLGWVGSYVVDQYVGRDNVDIIHLGDHAHMESLSSYDRGRKEMEGRRYSADIAAANAGFDELNAPLLKHNKHKAKLKEKQWQPRSKRILLGNHENRINVAISLDAKLDGTISTDDLNYAAHGWTVHPFLSVVQLEGVAFSHYFVNNANGRPLSGMIETQIKNVGCSFVQGHRQGLKVGMVESVSGRHRGIVAGSCYLKSEDYRGPQGAGEWRGILILHEVQNGDYCLMEVSLDFLCRRYEGVPVAKFMAKRYNIPYAA